MTDTSCSKLGRRNLNQRSFQVFQRATTLNCNGYGTADRWYLLMVRMVFTSERSTDTRNWLLNETSMYYSRYKSCKHSICKSYRIEAQNLQHLLYGTSSAKLTLLLGKVK